MNQELKIKGFDKFTKFAECMKKVMLEIEGIAHMPELDEKLKHYAGAEDQALWRDQAKDENYDLAGKHLTPNPTLISKSKLENKTFSRIPKWFEPKIFIIKSLKYKKPTKQSQVHGQ